MSKEQEAENPIGSYVTKCKICGKIHEWELLPIEGYKHLEFRQQLDLYLTDNNKDTVVLTQHMCDKCKFETVQDLVSYTEYPE